MPYIKKEDRPQFTAVETVSPKTAGELNYCITTLVTQYLKQETVSYAKINEVVGVLECAKLELYRRLAAPYEDTKIQENGDVSYPALQK